MSVAIDHLPDRLHPVDSSPAGARISATCSHSAEALRSVAPLRQAMRTSPWWHRIALGDLHARGKIRIEPVDLANERRRSGGFARTVIAVPGSAPAGRRARSPAPRPRRGGRRVRESRGQAVHQEAGDRIGRLLGPRRGCRAFRGKLLGECRDGLVRRRGILCGSILQPCIVPLVPRRFACRRNVDGGEHRLDHLRLARGLRLIEVLAEQRAGLRKTCEPVHFRI